MIPVEDRAFDYSNQNHISISEAIQHYKDTDRNLKLIENGAKFGECSLELFNPEAYFPFELIRVVNREQGIILIREPGCKGSQPREVSVCGLYIVKEE
jgi:hypothetical protein